MSTTIHPLPDSGDLITTTLAVEFMVNPNRIGDIAAKAAKIDDANNGTHLVTYTIEQALTVIFHEEPEWLFTSAVVSKLYGSRLPLLGWVVQTDLGWSENTDTHEEGK